MNRTLIALAGIALLGAGLWLLGATRAVADRLPAWWPAPPVDSVLLDREGLASLRETGWWAPAVMAAGTVITLLCLAWAVSRTPVRGPRPTGPLSTARAELGLTALEDAVCEDARRIEGVARARCRIALRRTSAHLALRVWTLPGYAAKDVLDGLGTVSTTVEHALHPRELNTRTRVSAQRHAAPHVR
ncbi:hypothetical protein LEL86_34465 [Streptomyces sp. WA6-1-16]|uniref:hypothetical protein n=1 Tax=Streptomyces sp. WA6-1-16 TaxID=2879427 RepID=UPI001CE2FEA5|nr:hypothetical protein [Streptomyces sp. WA6-1-16]UCA54064.1 hypothetical protein LEL86_34465 [Streptomyces sp. WA6-1-16]